jgi:hypothetical protein
MDYFPTESNKKTYVFVYITSKTIILLEIIIEVKDGPKNAFLN